MILRTSMIYGGSDDRHIKLIETLIKYLGFLPLPGNGKILRQPVHAQDVAFACIQILQRHRLWRPLSTKAYTIAGERAGQLSADAPAGVQKTPPEVYPDSVAGGLSRAGRQVHA